MSFLRYHSTEPYALRAMMNSEYHNHIPYGQRKLIPKHFGIVVLHSWIPRG